MISVKLKVAAVPLKPVVVSVVPLLFIRLREVICPAGAPVSVNVKLFIVTLKASGFTS